LIAFCFVCLPAVAQYSGGSGTADDPYQIATAADLMILGETPDDYDKHFILTADIDLDPNLPGRKVFDRAVIAPDANDAARTFRGPRFTGVFDGNGHAISHLTINGESYLGLFGTLGSGAMVSQVSLEAVEVNGTGDVVGGLVGYNNGRVTTSYSTGTIAGTRYVGGGVGANYGSVTASYSTAAVVGYSGVGGLVGDNAGQITVSYSAGGLVAGHQLVGGLVGVNVGPIIGSYSADSVAGDREVGGLVGWVNGGTATSSFWDVEISGQLSSFGGVGLTSAEMQDVNTFLAAHWDFVGEVHNGTCDYWDISAGEYPRLHFGAGVKPAMPEGFGTPEQPYLIRDARDFGAVWAEPSAHYRLAASVDLSGTTWLMAVVPRFSGTFQGQNNVIRNLRIRGHEYVGLFGELEAGATISSLGLDGVDVNGTGRYVGGLAGTNKGTITDCHSAGEVDGTGTYVHVGGLVGQNHGSLAASSSSGVVMGASCTGGLAGVNDGRIAMSHTAGSVTGHQWVGGLAGICRGIVIASHSTAAVTGRGEVGGLVGSNRGSGINTSYATGAVTGDWGVGGLVGSSSSPVTASYSTGAVAGQKRVGGLAGTNRDRITACYSTGRVNGDSHVGGLVGKEYDWGKLAVNQCFWDIQTSGKTVSAGGTGLITVEMQTAATFLDAGWDFVDETENGTDDIWWILEGQDYPRLGWERGDESPLQIK
jgi:hypothetical protein